MEELIAILLMGIGIWTFISPKGAFQFKAKLLKSIGVTATASPKSFRTFKYIGLALTVVGLLMYMG